MRLPYGAERSWVASASLAAPGWSKARDSSGRDGDMLTLLFQPAQGPRSMPVQVRVRAEPSRPVSTWVEAGYEVSDYDGSGLGPGLQCVAEQETELAGTRVTFLAAYYVFVAGQEAVVVEVAPTLRELFVMAFGGLHELLGTLEVRREDGAEFRAHPVPGYSIDAADTWAEAGVGGGRDDR